MFLIKKKFKGMVIPMQLVSERISENSAPK